MPPKARFTKEQITQAALAVVSQKGVQALTAKELGAALGTSTTPIFTVFSSMEEVEKAMVEAAKAIYKGYVEEGLKQDIPFRGVGEQYIRFAENEPWLFQMLFMSETATSLDRVIPTLDESYAKVLDSVMLTYGLDQTTAEQLYRHLWIYTHGIACLCATKTCQFSEQEIRNMMSEVFLSLLKNMGGDA